jgi:DNA-binding NtrC family response regulator
VPTHTKKTVAEETVEDESDNSVQISLQLDIPLREAREHFDSLYFNYQMEKEGGNIARIAEKIGIERTHLYRKLKQLGIKPLKKGSDENQ